MTKFFTHNLSFKLVALGVSLVLWFSMIGRKDSTLTKDYQLQVLLPGNTELAHPIPDFVRVEIAGPRISLKKLGQTVSVYTIDLTSAGVGRKLVKLNSDGVNLPLGAHVVSVEPKEFVAVIQTLSPEKERSSSEQ